LFITVVITFVEMRKPFFIGHHIFR